MTDLERARAICGHAHASITNAVAVELAEARREGAEAERARHEGASEIIQRAAELMKTGTEYERGAAEMRERAAQTAKHYEAPIWSVIIADAIRALPLTPEEPP